MEYLFGKPVFPRSHGATRPADAGLRSHQQIHQGKTILATNGLPILHLGLKGGRKKILTF